MFFSGVQKELMAGLQRAAFAVGCLLLTLAILHPAHAESAAPGPVQELTGRIDADEVVIYRVPGMRRGQQLMIRVETLSGNLDPTLGVIGSLVDRKQLEALYEEADEIAADRGGDPIAAMESLREKYFLAFDDDGGGGLTAALQFEIPEDGDYGLLIAGVQKARGWETFGNYRLLLGINRADVLDGSAQAEGSAIASRDLEATPPGVGVAEIAGSLDRNKTTTVIALEAMKEGDTLYAWLETTAGELTPVLQLNNFAGEPIRGSNLDGTASRATKATTSSVSSCRSRC